MQKTICLLPGDGIGPEIVAEAVKVLRAVEKMCIRDRSLLALGPRQARLRVFLRGEEVGKRRGKDVKNGGGEAARRESAPLLGC